MQQTFYRVDFYNRNGTRVLKGHDLYRSHTEACLAAFRADCNAITQMLRHGVANGVTVMQMGLTFQVEPVAL